MFFIGFFLVFLDILVVYYKTSNLFNRNLRLRIDSKMEDKN